MVIINQPTVHGTIPLFLALHRSLLESFNGELVSSDEGLMMELNPLYAWFVY